MINLASLLEFLLYAGSVLVIALVIREVGRPGGALSFADLLALFPERRPQHIPEEEPVRWKLERLSRPRRAGGAVARPPDRVAGGVRRTALAERPMSACEGC